ncbi:MAG: hypothetical protein M3Z32_09815 [Acidobacteriota bacterium]|nr:hypothetical protein [Acidobacteriota bacterium]
MQLDANPDHLLNAARKGGRHAWRPAKQNLWKAKESLDAFTVFSLKARLNAQIQTKSYPV